MGYLSISILSFLVFVGLLTRHELKLTKNAIHKLETTLLQLINSNWNNLTVTKASAKSISLQCKPCNTEFEIGSFNWEITNDASQCILCHILSKQLQHHVDGRKMCSTPAPLEVPQVSLDGKLIPASWMQSNPG